VVVRTVERAARVGAAQPFERLLVADVHAQGHLGLAAISTEVALPDEEPEEESDCQVAAIGRARLRAIRRRLWRKRRGSG